MNQAVSFGFLFGGGILLTRALTGSSYGDILKGQAGKVGASGHDFGGATSSGVAGVGTAISNATAGKLGLPSPTLATGNNPRGTAIVSVVDPIQAKGLVKERIDQGQDFGDQGGRIVSPTAGKILATVPMGQGWEGGAAVLEQLSTGAVVYFEEGVTPLVHAGQTVAAGTPIASLIPHFHAGVEAGLAAPTSHPGSNYIAGGYETLAESTTGYVEGQVTPAGKAFAAWLDSVHW